MIPSVLHLPSGQYSTFRRVTRSPCVSYSTLRTRGHARA